MLKESLNNWLPITQKEVKARGWHDVDIVLISGDAYVDHPSFGSSVVARIFESFGFKVAISPQPNWQDDLRDFTKFGKPNLFFAVTGGCMDSMVNHYTARKRMRSQDAYTPNGEIKFRPDYAVKTYSQILKKLYPDVPIMIGGIEASLRRVTHYDYWSDKLMPSLLIDSQADLLVYGMGELPLYEICRLMQKGVPFKSLHNVKQTCVLLNGDIDLQPSKKFKDRWLHSHTLCLKEKKKFAENFMYIERESNRQNGRRLLQKVNNKLLVINPAFSVMSEKQMDKAFELPFTRLPHPKYNKRGQIPAYEMIKFSINMHRGCFGGCSFCTISAHQGKAIASRSQKSILSEVEKVTQMPDFKGIISDLGGPSANMYKLEGIDKEWCARCSAPSCIYPKICPNLDTNHKAMLDIYQKVRQHPKIKKAYVSSGLRYDLFLSNDQSDNDKEDKLSHRKYFVELLKNHISGRLKVAPEHTSEKTLRLMRKPSFDLFYKLKEQFDMVKKKLNINLQLIPYFISAHPDTDLSDMADLAIQTKKLGLKLEQVQGFTPTPMTLATVIYYSGYHPYTMKKIKSVKNDAQRQEHSRLFFWYKRENKQKIRKSLEKIDRPDLANKLLGR